MATQQMGRATGIRAGKTGMLLEIGGILATPRRRQPEVGEAVPRGVGVAVNDAGASISATPMQG